MVAAFAVLIGALAGFAAGGRLRNLLRTDVRFLGFAPLWALFGLGAHRIDHDLAFVFLLLSLCSALAFVAGNARRIPGLWLVGLGLALNLLVTANNHGMPYDPSALESAGIIPPTLNATPVSTAITHPQGPHDQLAILGDVIPVAPLRSVVSFGDVFIAFGLAVVTMHGLTGRRDGRRALRFHVGQHQAGQHQARGSGTRPAVSSTAAVGESEIAGDGVLAPRVDVSTESVVGPLLGSVVGSVVGPGAEPVGDADGATVDTSVAEPPLLTGADMEDVRGEVVSGEVVRVDAQRRLDDAIQLVEVTGDETILLDLAPVDASGNVTHLDLSELAARHAVRQALAKHDLAGPSDAARYIDVHSEHVAVD